jgi:hypothetical protein
MPKLCTYVQRTPKGLGKVAKLRKDWKVSKEGNKNRSSMSRVVTRGWIGESKVNTVVTLVTGREKEKPASFKACY